MVRFGIFDKVKILSKYEHYMDVFLTLDDPFALSKHLTAHDVWCRHKIIFRTITNIFHCLYADKNDNMSGYWHTILSHAYPYHVPWLLCTASHKHLVLRVPCIMSNLSHGYLVYATLSHEYPFLWVLCFKSILFHGYIGSWVTCPIHPKMSCKIMSNFYHISKKPFIESFKP